MPCVKRPDIHRSRLAGFAVAWMLVLVAVIALATGGALHDTWFAQQLAVTRGEEQRAMAMAELGLRLGLRQLSAGGTPTTGPQTFRPDASQADTLELQVRPVARVLEPGSSAGRFVASDYEVTSTGRSSSRAQRVLVQGVRRLEIVEPDPPAGATPR